MAGRHPIVIRSVQTSRGDIDYCVYDFIKEVEKKPVIWNRMHIDSRNTAIVETNWISVARTIVPFIEELSEDEQSLIIEEFKNRWYKLRKDLMKNVLTIKKGTSGPCHFFRLMEFFLNSKKQYLKDILSEEDIETLKENEIIWRTENGFPPIENEHNKRTLPKENNKEANPKSANSKKAVEEISPSKRSARLQQKRIDKIETIEEIQPKTKKPKISTTEKIVTKKQPTQIAENPVESFGNISFDPMSLCETTSQPSLDDVNIQKDSQFDYRQQQKSTNYRIKNYAANSSSGNCLNSRDKVYDAHQAFFDSIKPTLRNLNDSQKLEFKIEVLKTLKKYKLY